MDSSFDKVHTMQKHFCPVSSTTTSNSSVAPLLSFFLSFFPFSPCPQSSPSLLKGWQRDPWEIMNSDLSTEMADSALAIGNNNNKRYPWAFVNMNTVAEAWVQNINNAGRENKYCAHNGSFKWHAIKKSVCQTNTIKLHLTLKILRKCLWATPPSLQQLYANNVVIYWFNCKANSLWKLSSLISVVWYIYERKEAKPLLCTYTLLQASHYLQYFLWVYVIHFNSTTAVCVWS